MSNIFYSEVDKNLQQELRYRGLSGRNRTTEDINFMLSKIANVKLTAYNGNLSDPNDVVKNYGTLGGYDVRSGRYVPNGPEGFLSETSYTVSSIAFDRADQAYLTSASYSDQTYRIGPYITEVNVTIGDHSMGLLNKATVRLSIPNPQRDLDGIEDTWFRPGRRVRIEIAQPDTAILSRDAEGHAGLLSPDIFPVKEQLMNMYPNWKIDELEKQIRKMNEYSFEGLITSFEFSYQPNGQVDASISLTGISNVYTDISMWMPTPKDNNAEPKKQKIETNPTLSKPVIPTNPDGSPNVATPTTASISKKTEFYDQLYSRVDGIIQKRIADTTNPAPAATGVIRYESEKGINNLVTDQYILYGEPYPPFANKFATLTIAAATRAFFPGAVSGNNKNNNVISKSKFSRYITLAGLIQFINDYLVAKKLETSADGASIICDSIYSCSNYYEYLSSCIPEDVLLLPKNTNTNGMNSYGDLTYYSSISSTAASNTNNSLDVWPGVHTVSEAADTNKIFASRIFINLETIQNILLGEDGTGGLTAGGSRGFTLKTFLATVSAKINYATGGAISLKLVTHPKDETKLLFIDTKYLKTPLTAGPPKVVEPFNVPMFANDEYGTIVRDSFTLSATLPENAKNLAYTLNESEDVTEEEIAPYLNFMYNAKDPDAINAIIGKYKNKHYENLKRLWETVTSYGESPGVPEKTQALYKALSTYVKYPTDDIRKSQQMTAPIFPFSAEFTIDGINGFRYGDVLEFKALPLKYRVNTVFSIISITHNVSTDGQWTTVCRCIMRPSIR
jgi:hypothetical protein